jgi:hypothetical protein
MTTLMVVGHSHTSELEVLWLLDCVSVVVAQASGVNCKTMRSVGKAGFNWVSDNTFGTNIGEPKFFFN